MKKISTVFKKNPNNLALVINEVNPENKWVLDGEGMATRKWDGTACAVIHSELYKRYDVKKGKAVPGGAIPCQEPDQITGHWPHWVKCDRDNPGDKYHWEAFDLFGNYKDGTYELCGPKINGGREGLERHFLIEHGSDILAVDRTFQEIERYLTYNNIEGIVFHHQDGRMAKIRKSDFGIKR